MNTLNPNQQVQTYPFPSTNGVDSSQPGVNQTFNIQPTASSGQPSAPGARPKMMKKGGTVKSKSKPKVKCMARGGGCEVKGKTKGRFV